VRIHDLRIEEGEATVAQVRNQVAQSGLRGVIASPEHGLATKKSPHRDTVEPAHRFAALVDLHAVGLAPPVKLAVRRDEILGDPGFGPVGGWLRTSPDGPLEIPVEVEGPVGLTDPLAQATRLTKRGQLEDRPGVGAPPGHRGLGRPWKYAHAICLFEHIWTQRSTHRDETIVGRYQIATHLVNNRTFQALASRHWGLSRIALSLGARVGGTTRPPM
jgi:hypothetical protein